MAGCLKAAPAYLLWEFTAGPTCPLPRKFMARPLLSNHSLLVDIVPSQNPWPTHPPRNQSPSLFNPFIRLPSASPFYFFHSNPSFPFPLDCVHPSRCLCPPRLRCLSHTVRGRAASTSTLCLMGEGLSLMSEKKLYYTTLEFKCSGGKNYTKKWMMAFNSDDALSNFFSFLRRTQSRKLEP